MKKAGAICEFGKQRDKELLQAFKEQLHLLGNMPQEELFERARKTTASRFWVSEARATTVIRSMLKGDQITTMNPKKREMFFEIYRRVKDILDRNPKAKIPETVFRVVNSKAPEFYLTPKSAKALIYRIRA